MKFFTDNPTNLFLLTLALVSGGLLLFPVLQRRGAKLSPLQATQLINRGKPLVLDVRAADEFAAGHLRESRNIALPELETRIGELDKQKGKPVILVCQNGIRSAKAAALLTKAGFAEVSSLDGGIAAWRAGGLPLARPAEPEAKPVVQLSKKGRRA